MDELGVGSEQPSEGSPPEPVTPAPATPDPAPRDPSQLTGPASADSDPADPSPETDPAGCKRVSLWDVGDEEWDVEEAWDLDPFADPDRPTHDDGGGGGPDTGDDADTGEGEGAGVDEDARAREVIAAALAVVDADAVLVAAKQSRAVLAYAEMARRWRCPHAEAVTDEDWARVSAGWVRRGPHRGMSIGGVHEGLHGVCWEAISAVGSVLAAHHGRWTPSWAVHQIVLGIQLAAVLPATLAGWSAGRLDARQVDVIVSAVSHVHDEGVLAAVDARLCGAGPQDVDALVVTARLTLGACSPSLGMST